MEMEDYRAANPKVTPCYHVYVMPMLPIQYLPRFHICYLYDSCLYHAYAASSPAFHLSLSTNFTSQHTSIYTPSYDLLPLYHILLNVQVHEVPFNSSNKWQMSIHHMKYNDKQLLLLKVCDPITVVFIPV